MIRLDICQSSGFCFSGLVKVHELRCVWEVQWDDVIWWGRWTKMGKYGKAIQLIFMKFLNLILLVLPFIKAATDADFAKLKIALLKLFEADADMRTYMVRLNFHDLLHQRRARNRGCTRKPAFMNANGNGGVDDPIQGLEKTIPSKDLQRSKGQDITESKLPFW